MSTKSCSIPIGSTGGHSVTLRANIASIPIAATANRRHRFQIAFFGSMKAQRSSVYQNIASATGPIHIQVGSIEVAGLLGEVTLPVSSLEQRDLFFELDAAYKQ